MAQFRTAKDQYILPLDVAVKGAVGEGTKITSTNRKTAICAGDFVVLTAASGNVPAYITKATAAQLSAKTATHIVALTDQTIGDGHVATDMADYAASDLVGSTTTGSVAAGTPVKKVGLYPIFDWGDIIPDADANDVTA